MLNDFRKSLARLIAPSQNSMTLPNQYLRYGRNTMRPNWTEVVMDDYDHYTGYGYATIRNRAIKVARTAIDNLRIETEIKDFNHPYIDLIKNSKNFTEFDFWEKISTYLDLEGVYYLMVVRNVNGERYGNIQEFKLLNPYRIRRVLDSERKEVTGYVETNNGLVREIPAGMVIEMRELNPFDEDKNWSMTDAAKEPQFTIKTSGDYTRHALKNNINAPGILATDVVLDDEEFKNFKQRIKEHTKGEPIFGNGQGAITYNNMQIELSKAGLKEVTDVSLEQLMAVSGTSKSLMGIEQSGVTRETSRVQKELNMEDHILPRVQKIIGALNQDYKYHSPNPKPAMIMVDNPMSVDLDADTKQIDLKDKRFDLYQKLINRDVDKEIAAQYINGEVDLDAIDIEKFEMPVVEDEDVKKNSISQGVVSQQEGALQNAIVDIDSRLVSAAINRLPKKLNELSETDLVTKAEQKDSIQDLITYLVGFYGILMMLRGREQADDRMGELGLLVTFKIDSIINKYIRNITKEVATGHIETIVDDIVTTARTMAKEGKSVAEIQRQLHQYYSGQMSQSRAKTVARTETNRAFNRAQYEADRQMLKQHDLTAYKVFKTRSGNPCPYCSALEAQGKVPFSTPFIKKGDSLTVRVDGKEQTITNTFEDVQAGNIHPNCNCTYTLIIE
jgi:phage portal protein BeeE